MANEKGGAEASAGPPAESLPVIPEGLGIDPLLLALLHCASFLDLSGDTLVDSGSATDVLEHVGLYVQRLDPDRQLDVARQLRALREHGEAAGWSGELIDFVEHFLYSCGIGEDVDE